MPGNSSPVLTGIYLVRHLIWPKFFLPRLEFIAMYGVFFVLFFFFLYMTVGSIVVWVKTESLYKSAWYTG